MRKKRVHKIFFNASVILAGIKSPKGGSAKLLNWAKENNIKGVISEIVVDEVIRRANKIDLEKKDAQKKIISIFKLVLPAPHEKLIKKWCSLVLDYGDTHVLASTDESKCQFLVSLDKKHLLTLAGKIKKYKIVSPGQLIRFLSK